MKTPRSIRAAFTLIELMIVVLVVGVLIGGAGFVLSSGFEATKRAHSEGRRLTGMLERANRYQQNNQELAWVEYDLKEQRVRLYLQTPLESGETIDDVYDDEEAYMSLVSTYNFGDPDDLENSATILDGVVTYEGREYKGEDLYLVRFDPNGSSVGHIVYIRHKPDTKGEEDGFVSVDFNPVTGLASVYLFEKILEKAKDLP